MSGDPSKLITVEWSVVRDETEAYVREFTDGQLALTFGPMPPEVVDQFLRDRKAAIKTLFDRIINKLNQEITNGFQNSSHQAEPISD